jgi:hypothetical protein
MSLCEYSNRCNLYGKDKKALNEIEKKYGKDSLPYKIVFAKLDKTCNHKHMLCLERVKFEE